MLGRVEPLALFAHATLASPYLVVYSEPQGYRAMTLQASVLLELEGGEQRTIKINRDSYNAIAAQENPFNRHILTLGYMAALFMLFNPEDAKLREAILRQGFCDKGPMTEYLDLALPVERLVVTITGDFPSAKVVPLLEVHCRP
jgi:hypothetical protein